VGGCNLLHLNAHRQARVWTAPWDIASDILRVATAPAMASRARECWRSCILMQELWCRHFAAGHQIWKLQGHFSNELQTPSCRRLGVCRAQRPPAAPPKCHGQG
jgi:hypothetical protein